MRGDIGQYAKGLRASVRVFANTAAITEFLPESLAPWMAAHPQIDVDLKERGSSEIARSVSAGFAEIGILSCAVETGDLIMRPFAIDRLVIVVSREHRLTGNKAVCAVEDCFSGTLTSTLASNPAKAALSCTK
nr:LysR substrate-binding domain-containing protein [Gluconobacter wancherniae]